MVDRPIIMSAAMVLACIREARNPGAGKTATRRFAWQHGLGPEDMHGVEKPTPWQKVAAGDRLWVRETWCDANSDFGPLICYRADNHRWQPPYTGKDFGAGPSFNYDKYPGRYAIWAADLEREDRGWRSPIHMPRWASRLTLLVSATKTERLQDITEADAKAEGVEPAISGHDVDGPLRSHRTGFVRLWGELHGTESWLDNPWVVCVSFRPVLANLDRISKQETA